MIKRREIEIMAPAGSFENLMSAIKAGTDSVYFGVGELNMRSRSANFTIKDLKKIAKICKENNVKSYLTLNTVIYDSDFKNMKKICDDAKKYGVDALIICDVAAMKYARSIGLEVHSSTQLNISNIEAVKFYSQFTDVVVLARELSLKQIKEICLQIKKQNVTGPSGELVKVEVFCHGALCVSISGKCYMSLGIFNMSANRGGCFQNCRRAYRVIDEETGDELKIDNKYVMSPKDLCTIGMIDKLIDAGISVLKIEGRARQPEYTYTVVKCYKEAVQSVFDGTYCKKKIDLWLKELESVYNRGFWMNGYYLGKKLGEWAGSYGSQASKEKKYIGYVKNYFSKVNVAEIILEADFNSSDEILIIGPTTGLVSVKNFKFFVDDAEVKKPKKGQDVTLKIKDKVRRNDKVYVLMNRKN